MKNEKNNTIEILENGPVYFRGNIEVQNSDGETVLTREKIALCRCGQSMGKPACDGSHRKAGFKAGMSVDVSDLPANGHRNPGKLVLKTMKDGPILVHGSYTITSTAGEHSSDKNIALCRCGASSNKPFCDGSHKTLPFRAS
ncbi:MAG: CDGSH iron-sulfur domain-containing protein [Balneolaceae bacterium]